MQIADLSKFSVLRKENMYKTKTTEWHNERKPKRLTLYNIFAETNWKRIDKEDLLINTLFESLTKISLDFKGR